MTNRKYKGPMTATADEIAAVTAYLEEYLFLNTLVDVEEYEKTYFGSKDSGEEIFRRARRYEIRAFIDSLPNCREKIFLFCRYVRGHSVETCSELMDISRRSAYRVRDDALKLAAVHYRHKKETECAG